MNDQKVSIPFSRILKVYQWEVIAIGSVALPG